MPRVAAVCPPRRQRLPLQWRGGSKPPKLQSGMHFYHKGTKKDKEIQERLNPYRLWCDFIVEQVFIDSQVIKWYENGVIPIDLARCKPVRFE